MATYAEIQSYIRIKNGFAVKTCWIADVKNQFGLITRIAYNRKSSKRLHPCPGNKKKHIIEAFRHFKMIS